MSSLIMPWEIAQEGQIYRYRDNLGNRHIKDEAAKNFLNERFKNLKLQTSGI